MGSDQFLVQFCAPTRSHRKQHVSIANGWGMVDGIVAPGDVVDVVFHDSQIADSCTEMGTHQRRQWTAMIVWRDVDFKKLGHIGNLLGSGNAYPPGIHKADVHATSVKECLVGS